jgi:hypothetical protein
MANVVLLDKLLGCIIATVPTVVILMWDKWYDFKRFVEHIKVIFIFSSACALPPSQCQCIIPSANLYSVISSTTTYTTKSFERKLVVLKT